MDMVVSGLVCVGVSVLVGVGVSVLVRVCEWI